jgi:hypothetical protein
LSIGRTPWQHCLQATRRVTADCDLEHLQIVLNALLIAFKLG